MTDLRPRAETATALLPPAEQAGPASPTPTAAGALRPLRPDAVRLDPAGLLGAWQERNATATIPHCIQKLDASGNLDNLRRVRTGSGEFRGMWFADSDIYKTLEAAAWQLARVPDDPAPRAFLDTAAALLADTQDPDGYLNSYFQADHRQRQWQELRWSHELYCAGHLIQAAVAAARAGVGADLLPVARRFADLLVRRFGPDGDEGVCGHPEIETAMVELYRLTGHPPYLDLATRFIDRRGRGLLGEDQFGRPYYQDHVPVRDAQEVTGHAVRQLYLLAGMVDVAVETGDEALLRTAERLWESAFDTRTYLTGGHGSRHRDEAFGDPYELPPDRAYAETCAAIASFHWNWRMLLATAGHRYADELERVLYNAIAAGLSIDGTRFFYSNPLQLRTGHDGSNEDAPSGRLPWYSCSCCPPNLARLLASVQSYLATADDTGVQVHLYSTGTIHIGQTRIDVRTGYPWQGRIGLTVHPGSAGPDGGRWTLALRVPGWCTAFTAQVDGERVDGEPVNAAADDGYLRLTRDWSAGGEVVLDLDMPPRLVAAHPRVDAVRGCLALMRGPLLYCLEQADLPAGVQLEDVRLDPAAPVRAVDPADPAIPVALVAGGTAPPPASATLYRQHTPSPVDATDAPGLTLTAVPYFLWANRIPGPMRIWIPITAA